MQADPNVIIMIDDEQNAAQQEEKKDKPNDKKDVSPLFLATKNNSESMVKLLVNNGADVNFVNQHNNQCCLSYAAEHNNVLIFEYILDTTNKIQFDWKKLINNQVKATGDSVFLSLCAVGNVECLNYLFNIQTIRNYSTKIDIYAKRNKKFGAANGLHCACITNSSKMLQFLMRNV